MTEIEEKLKKLSEPFDARFIQQKPGPGGRRMDFVSHGTVTKRLNERAPGWSSRIVASGVDVTQSPKGGLLYTADVTLELTVAGVTRAEVGTNNQPVADRGQALKSAASDALKRAAMRFGVALDLWESLDEQDEDAEYATTPRAGSAGPGREAPAPRRSAPPTDRPAAVPGAVGPPSPGQATAEELEELVGADFGWTEFWSWARQRGYSDRTSLDAAVGRPTKGMTPVEIRAALRKVPA